MSLAGAPRPHPGVTCLPEPTSQEYVRPYATKLPWRTPTTLDRPVPLPPPLSPPPSKVQVPTHPLSSNAHKAKPSRVFTHSHPTWDADPTLLPKKPPGRT